MDCTLAALLSCFSLSGVYIDSGLSVLDSEIPAYNLSAQQWQAPDQTLLRLEGHLVNPKTENPYGRLAIGYEIDFMSVRVAIEASHLSSVATNKDRGINSLSLSMRWFPFR